MSSRSLSSAEFQYFHDPDLEDAAINVDSSVFVEARTSPGVNKLGGFGTVTKVHENGHFDVKYAVNGKERHVESRFVHFSTAAEVDLSRRKHIQDADGDRDYTAGIILGAIDLVKVPSSRRSKNKVGVRSPSGCPITLNSSKATGPIPLEGATRLSKTDQVLLLMLQWGVRGSGRKGWGKIDADMKQRRVSEALNAYHHYDDLGAASRPSIQAIATAFGASRQTLLRVICGKTSISRVGVRGRKAGMDSQMLNFFVHVVNAASEAGNAMTREDVANLFTDVLHALNRSVNVKTRDGIVDDIRKRVPKLTTRKATKRNTLKRQASSPKQVFGLFTRLAGIARENEWPGSPKGTPTIPARALCNWDEIACVSHADKGFKAVCLKGTKPISADPVDSSFKLTMFVGVRFDGSPMPPFLVFSGKTWSADPDRPRLHSAPEDWSAMWTDTGSMKSGASSGEKTAPGQSNTMLGWSAHNIPHARRVARVAKDEKYKFVDILDQASCHVDAQAWQNLRDAGHVLVGAPANTSHYLQVLDHKGLNGVMQTLRRKEFVRLAKVDGRVTADNVIDALVPSFFSAYKKTNIISAVKGVGFTYVEDRKFIDFSDKAIAHAMNLHREVYKCNLDSQGSFPTTTVDETINFVTKTLQRRGIGMLTSLSPMMKRVIEQAITPRASKNAKGRTHVKFTEKNLKELTEAWDVNSHVVSGITMTRSTEIALLKARNAKKREAEATRVRAASIKSMRSNAADMADRIRRFSSSNVPHTLWTRDELKAAVALEPRLTATKVLSSATKVQLIELLRDPANAPARVAPTRADPPPMPTEPREQRGAKRKATEAASGRRKRGRPRATARAQHKNGVPDMTAAVRGHERTGSSRAENVTSEGTQQTTLRRPSRRASRGVADAVKALLPRRARKHTH